MKQKSLQQRTALNVARSRRDVFLTRDVATKSDEDQVIRALRGLVAENKLLRLGKGVYANARPSRICDEPVLANTAGFQAVAKQALNRFGVQLRPTEIQLAFAENRSTQIPVNPVVKVNGRFS